MTVPYDVICLDRSMILDIMPSFLFSCLLGFWMRSTSSLVSCPHKYFCFARQTWNSKTSGRRLWQDEGPKLAILCLTFCTWAKNEYNRLRLMLGWLSNFPDPTINWYWYDEINAPLLTETKQQICIKTEKCLSQPPLRASQSTYGQPGTGKLSSPIRSTWNPNFQQKPHNEFTKKTEKCLAQPPHGLHSRSCLRWDLPTIKRLVWPYIRVGSLVLDGVCLWGGKGATTVACAIQPLHALQIIQDGVFSIYYPLSIQFSLVMKNDKYISYPLIYPHSY